MGGRPSTPSLLFLVLLALVLVLPASGARGGPHSEVIHVYVVAPSNAVTHITPAQAVSAITSWMGSPSDPSCIGSQFTCTIEGWFRHELGQVFDYDVTLVSAGPVDPGNPTDACGSWSNFADTWAIGFAKAVGASFTKNDRTMLLMVGAGGWAGHYAPTNNVPDHYGMSGDWGVMQQYGVPNACQLAWDPGQLSGPAHGYSHEFAGMMGAYITAQYNEFGLFLGDVLSAHERHDLIKYSGKWLHSP